MIFPGSSEGIVQDDLEGHIRAIAADSASVDFTCRYALVYDDAGCDDYYIFLVPDEGFSGISLLHDRLYGDFMRPKLRLDIPYVPHIGIATSKDREELYELARQWNRMGHEVSGTIDELTLSSYDGSRVADLKHFPLNNKRENSRAWQLAIKSLIESKLDLAGATTHRCAEMNSPQNFYAGLSPFYHLIYPDWEGSMRRQASHLDSVIRELWGSDGRSVLDTSCGIGTQSLGLAALGYDVTGSDLSPEEVERAKKEAEKRNLTIGFHVCDMRRVSDHFGKQFDLVISCDNSVPHLLTDEDIRQAFQQFWRCTRPGGGCIITVRDYEKEDFSQRQVKPYGIRDHEGTRWLLSQVWEPNDRTYNVSMYLIEDLGETHCRTHVFRTSYYPVSIRRLMELMRESGFQDVMRIDERFFQPIIVGTRKAQQGACTQNSVA